MCEVQIQDGKNYDLTRTYPLHELFFPTPACIYRQKNERLLFDDSLRCSAAWNVFTFLPTLAYGMDMENSFFFEGIT
jgi:hypothetical protein